MFWGVEGIDHLDLAVSDLERSLAFYADCRRSATRGRARSGDAGRVYVARGRMGSVSLRERQSHARERPYDRYDLGIHHIAFAAPSREAVDERHAWAREHGVEIESEPREYDYTPGYYALFLHDPDGLKLEILHRP